MTSILLVGIGGYGSFIAGEVLENAAKHDAYVVGVVEPYPENSPVSQRLGNIPVFKDIADFYKTHTADLAIISTPIHLHKSQCIIAMEHGSDVLCEKPIAPTLQDAYLMAECAKRTGKNLTIGFQLSHTPAILKLKQDIMDNRFGKVESMYATVCWPRNKAYFARPWAAKAKLNGQWVLDSIVMNACAHYLHNMFFLLGQSLSTAAQPQTMGASVYRANPIETYDTAFIKVITDNNIPVCFTASHATKENINPVTVVRLQQATVYITEDGGDSSVYAIDASGNKIIYGATYDSRFEKIWYALAVLRKQKQPVCTVETALPHLKCVNAISQYVAVKEFDNVETINDVNCVNGLDDMMQAAFKANTMPELYQPASIIDMTQYKEFSL